MASVNYLSPLYAKGKGKLYLDGDDSGLPQLDSSELLDKLTFSDVRIEHFPGRTNVVDMGCRHGTIFTKKTKLV